MIPLACSSTESLRLFPAEKGPKPRRTVGNWRQLMVRHLDRIRTVPQEGILMVERDVLPGKALSATLERLLRSETRGWYFSVSPLPFYAHDILIKQDKRMTNFQMEGVYTFDMEKAMFFNHITGRHFIHSQEAPTLLSADGRACFIPLRSFELDLPLPYSFTGDDYTCRN
ncbi:MAG: hypothetical protein JXL84_18305 [Deltaproteobacteria bacterium]|nr:hypothetical protein [Deltaproteobacteria bacterium]